ncbi:MAG: hypothetical protein COB88_06740 [Flavobacteriales bacterium]|nr:MAG: hypothetical protein COB88_06740 [Flavobacteriales bacterium]
MLYLSCMPAHMRLFLLTAVIFSFINPLQGQFVSKILLTESCKCFEEASLEVDSAAYNKSLESCFKGYKKKWKKKIENEIGTVDQQIEYLRALVKECIYLESYLTINSSTFNELRAADKTSVIELAISYFSFPSEKGKLPKMVNVPMGYAGLLYSKAMSKVYSDSIYRSGIHLIHAYDSLILYSIRQEEVTEELIVLTSDEMEVKLHATCFFSLIPDSVKKLEVERGRSYRESVLIPSLRSKVRGVISEFSSQQLYTAEIKKLEGLVWKELSDYGYLSDYFFINGILLRNIEFPHLLNRARESNLLNEYESLMNDTMDIRLNAIKVLFDNGSETAYLLLLDHWGKEEEQEILDYIVREMARNK